MTLPDGTVVSADDGPRAGVTYDALKDLKPVFRPDGVVTAGNCCALNDGAAAVVIMSDTKAAELGLTPLARIVGHTTHSQHPSEFTIAPVGAIGKLLDRLGWQAQEVDLFEINEAFAVVAEKYQRDLDLDRTKVNVNGGAIALGHPLGCSGAKLMTTLLHELERTGGRFGLQTMCEGGGQANVTILERL